MNGELQVEKLKMWQLCNKAVTDTHVGLGILVGAGIDQQPCTVRAAIPSGAEQRRRSALRRTCNTHNKQN